MERVNFTWYDYSEHVTDTIQEMFFSNDFKDVTLVSEDKNEIRAHKNILSASSPVLKRLITDNHGNQPILLDGVRYNELLCVLQYVYLGETKLFKANMNSFLTAAKKLQIKDLEKNVKRKIDEIKVAKLASMERTQSLTKTECEEVEILEVKEEKTMVKESVEHPIQANDADKEQASPNKEIDSQKDEGTVKRQDCVVTETISQVVEDTETPEGDDPYMLNPKMNLKERKKKEKTTLEEYFEPTNQASDAGPGSINKVIEGTAKEQSCVSTETISQVAKDTIKSSETPEDDDPYMLKPKMILEERKKKEKALETFSCKDCEYQTRKKAKLEMHINVYHLGNRHKCDQCAYEAKYIGSLKLHISAKHEGVIFKCQFCELHYSRKGHLKRHVQAVHEESKEEHKHKCHECSYSTVNKGHLRRHIGRKHYGQPPEVRSRNHQCPQCDYRAFTRSHLKRHMLRKHACPYCDFVAPYGFHELQKHSHDLHGKELCMCKVCDKVLKIERLQEHKKHNHGDDAKYSCKECDYKFNLSDAYKRHMLFKHKEKVKSINCKLCPEKFIFKRSRRDHLVTKHTLKCDACDFVGSTELSLNKHKKRNHTIHKQHKCDDCDFVCRTELSLDKHKKAKHTMQNVPKKKSNVRFECKFCPEKFNLKRKLEKHMKSSHVEQTYSCDLCGYVGTKQLFLDMHKKLKHIALPVSPNPKKTDMSFNEALETRTNIQESPVSRAQQSHEFSNKIDSVVDDFWS